MTAEEFLDGPAPAQPTSAPPQDSAEAFLDAPDPAPSPAPAPEPMSAEAFLDSPDPLPDPQAQERNAPLNAIGRSLQRGWVRSQLSNELSKDVPRADIVQQYQQQLQKLPPSDSFAGAMNDKITPAESWQAFKSNPVAVMGELLGESFAGFTHQMIDKAPARVAIGAGAGAAMGAPIMGIGAGPGFVTGARAGFAQSAGAASYTLEMSDGILESLEKAGVNLADPAAMQEAFNDPERMKLAREFAQKKAIPIAIFDGGSALLAGSLFRSAASSRLAKVGRGAIEMAVQSGLGMAGEAAGQINQKGEITSGRSVLAEGLAEVPVAAVEVGAGLLAKDTMRVAEQEQADINAAKQAEPVEPAAPAQEPAPQPPVAQEPAAQLAEQPAGPPIDIPAAEPAAPVEAPAPAPSVEPPTPQLATPADTAPVEAAQVGVEGEAQIVPAVQETAVVPSYQQDLEAAKDIKDAKGRSQIVTPAQAAKMSDEKLLIAYGGAAVAMQNGGDSPLSRVNIAAWHNELVKRGLMEPSPAISSYAVTAQPQSPVVGDGRQGEAQNLQSEQQPSPASKNAGSSENVAAPASYLGKPYDPAALAEKAKRDGYELVYHGDRNQPMQEGYKPWDSANLPLFTSADPEAASWYGEPRPLFIKSSKIATEQDLVAAARKVGVKGTYGQPGEEVNIPEVSKVSSYEGYNQNDLVYIPRVREELVRQGFDAVKVWDQLERDEIEATIIIGSPDQVVDPLAEPAQPQPAAAAVDAAVMPDASNVLAGEQNAAKTPKVGEVIGTTSDGRIEFVMAKGLLEGRPDMFTVGLRSAGSNAAPEPGGYGHNTNKDRVLERFVEKESGANAIISSPYVKAMADARAKAAAEAKSKKDAADKARQDEEQRNREAKAAYDASVAATPLPKGEQAMLTVQQNDGSTRLEPSTRYGDFAIRKIGGKKAKYQIDHWHSGLKVVDADSLGEAKTLVRAFIHSGADMSVRAPSKEDVALLAQVVVHQRSGGMPLPQVKGSGQVTGQDAGQVAPTIKTRLKRNLKSNSGALDAEILADLVEYGKQFYRAGMTFGKWASQMVREFGQGVSKWLRQAYDSIVKAYKDSPWSSEAGAVNQTGFNNVKRDGNDPVPSPMPEPKKQKRGMFGRRFEASNVALPDAKLKAGTFYGVYSMPAVIEEGKKWVNENGIEAAAVRLEELVATKIQPSPVDIAIGLEATGRAAGQNDPDMQSRLAIALDEMGTTGGQVTNMYSAFAMLTPEGIIYYVRKKIRRHIGSLNPDRQAQVRADEEELAALRVELGNLRKQFATNAITDTRWGGGTIKTRIEKRLGDAATDVLLRLRDAIQKGFNPTETKAEAFNVLREAGVPDGEAESMAKILTDTFIKSLEDARRDLAINRVSVLANQKKAVNQLLAEMSKGGMSDTEFMAQLSQIKGVPALTQKLADRLKKMAQEYQDTPDPIIKRVKGYQINEEIASMMPTEIAAKMRSYTYLAQLLWPVTIIVNILGNSVYWVFNVPKDAIINGIVDPAMAVVTGERKSAYSPRQAGIRAASGMGIGAVAGTILLGPAGIIPGAAVGAAMGGIYGVAGGKRARGMLAPTLDIVRGFQHAAQYNGYSGIRANVKNVAEGLEHLRVLAKMTTQNKFDLADIKDATRKNFSSTVGRGFEATLSLVLGGPDRAFAESAYQSSMEAQIQAAKLNGEWDGAPTPDMHEAAQADMMEAVHQEDNFLSRFMSRIRSAFNDGGSFGPGNAIFMFAQVVGALGVKGAVNWSPVGFIRTGYKGFRGILFASSGGRHGARFDQRAFTKAFTEALVGSGGLYITGYWLAEMGIVIAGPDDDEKMEALRRASGIQNYTINLTALRRMFVSGDFINPQPTLDGDLMMPYAWAQPATITFAAGAELSQIRRSQGLKGLKKGIQESPSLVAMSMAAGAQSLKELPMLSGFSSFMSSYQANDGNIVAAFYETVLKMPSMFVPQAVRAANKWNDNYFRETRGRSEFLEKLGITDDAAQRAFQQIASGIPGLADKFPPRFDLLGRANERYQYESNSIANIIFNPIMTRRVAADPVLLEINNIVSATGDTSVVPREPDSRKITLNGQPYEMTNEQLAAYKFYLGGATDAILRRLVAAPNYAALPMAARVEVFAGVTKQVNAAIKSVVLGENPERLSSSEQQIAAMILMSDLSRTPVPDPASRLEQTFGR